MSTTAKYSLTWDLDSLMPHPETDEFREILDSFKHDLEVLAKRTSQLPSIDGNPENTDQWIGLLADYENVSARSDDLRSFIGCHAAADAQNKLFQQMEAHLSSLEPLEEQITTNIDFALKSATQQQLAEFTNADQRLQRIEFFLQDRRRYADVRLPKQQEMLAAELAVDGIHAWGRLYDRISGELRVEVMQRGEIVEKSVGQVQFDSPQRLARENNFYAADRAWKGIADLCADAVNHIAGTRLTIYRRLGLEDHLVVPCVLNRLRRKTLDTMWSVVAERKTTLIKYLEQKAEAFGLEKLAWYDLTAPYPTSGRAAGEITYDEACDRVIGSLNGFSSELGEFAGQAIQNRWVEVENRPGKRQGGFCTGFPSMWQSRIFMTFTGSVDSMSTLAHELGHAYHSYVLRDQPLLLRRYPMNLAETASTFAETIVGELRLKETDAADEKLEILDAMLSDAVAFLMNIHARYIFEDNFHQRRATGELPADELSTMMTDAQKQAFADGLADDGWNPNFWISKLHFYISGWPFYNFPYTFGYLLSLGVYSLGSEGGDEFPEQYRRFLIATGCENTEQAVQSTFGYDLAQPDFWHRSMDIVDDRVERFLQLAADRS